MLGILPGSGHGPGSGSALGPAILISAGLATLVATGVSAVSIFLHIKNYRKPVLQRCAPPRPRAPQVLLIV
jgi:hypothetical protein